MSTDNEILYNDATGNLSIYKIDENLKVIFPKFQDVSLLFDKSNLCNY